MATAYRTAATLPTARFAAIGSQAEVCVTEPALLRDAEEFLRRQITELDLACSRFRDDSELAEVNRRAGVAVPVGPLLLRALRAALYAARATDGDVDPTVGGAIEAYGWDRDFAALDDVQRVDGVHARHAVPGWRRVVVDLGRGTVRIPRGARLDLGATAKAFAADRAAHDLAETLGCGVLVSLGGDVAVAGKPQLGGWSVRVTDDHAAPRDADAQVVTLSTGGLATSSTAVRRWTVGDGVSEREIHHIIDPRQGAPARSSWRTVSVAARSCLDANAASTASIVRGARAAAWLRQASFPARLVAPSGHVTTVGGWPR